MSISSTSSVSTAIQATVQQSVLTPGSHRHNHQNLAVNAKTQQASQSEAPSEISKAANGSIDVKA